jgi:hypothetical protein
MTFTGQSDFLQKFLTLLGSGLIFCVCAADAAFRAEQLKVAIPGWLR